MTLVDAQSVVVAAPAKVNLSLHVLGRRSDGYHLIDSLIVFAGVGDHVEAQPDETLRLEVTGGFAPGVPRAPANLVWRAAVLLAEVAGVPAAARLVLNKQLPVAAGLGGGSADAAATLIALSRLWGLALDAETLAGLAVGLGADVPVCLYGRPAFAGGIGEELQASPPLPPVWLLLVNPGIGLATATVFQARRGAYSTARRWSQPLARAEDLAERLAECRNDLEPAARRLCPAIDEVLAALSASHGCLLARMSGSGASCFGLYAEAGAAQAAAAELAAAKPAWWLRVAPLLAPEDELA
jgi:4-diphosphocytidyl-2-C-methyl-D-erythritol kinase